MIERQLVPFAQQYPCSFCYDSWQTVVVKISHPPYSLYLAPCDTLLFPKAVTALEGRRLQDVDIKMKVTTKLNAVTLDASVTVLCNL